MDDERIWPKLRQSARNGAARVEKRRPLVGDDDSRALAAREMRLEPIGVMVDVNDSLIDARRGEAIEHMIDECLSAERDERFGKLIGERPHARAEARREHHG